MLDRLHRAIKVGDIVSSAFEFGTAFRVVRLDDKFVDLRRVYRGRKVVRFNVVDYFWYICG